MFGSRPGALPPHREARAALGLVANRLQTVARLASDYPGGAVVHVPFGRVVVVSSPAAVQHVLVKSAGKYAKGMGQAEAAPLLGQGLLTSEHQTWRAQRREITPLLRARRIQELTPAIAARAADSVAALARRPGMVQPARPLADYTLSCLAATIGFETPDPDVIMDSFSAIQREAMFAATTKSKIPLVLRPITRARVLRAQRALTDEITRVVGDTLGVHPEPTSRDGMVSLLLAGYETTASTLGWVVDHLSRDPLLQRQIAAEAAAHPGAMRGQAPPTDLVTSRRLFRAMVLERPPVWLISRRALEPDEIDGIPIRADDDIAISLHTLHHSQDPAAGLGGGSPAHERNEMPFGGGPRGCPGGALAETEAILWIAHACASVQFHSLTGRPAAGHARMSYGVDEGFAVGVERRFAMEQAGSAAQALREPRLDAA